jgi:demethylmenaquinone methyltransferase/2-methoxy-6-polyprenyl-1,4-benzoquinol methylase
MPIIDHFGILAPFYDRVIQIREPEELIRLGRFPVEGRLLDAGGGTGRVSKALKDYVSSVVVADLSFDMLRQANGKGCLSTVCSHTESLPFPDESFERIIMIDALHHVCDHKITVQELWRLLKPGGRMIIEEPDIRTIPVKFIALAEKMALMRSHFVSPPEIKSLFSNYKNSKSNIENNRAISWVIVDKVENDNKI